LANSRFLFARSFLDAAATKPSAEFPLRRSGDVWHVAIANLPRSGVRYGASRRRTEGAALRSPLTAQASRSAATAAGRRATGGIPTSCCSTRARPAPLDCFTPCCLRCSRRASPLCAAADAIRCVFPARRYAPLVAGRDKFADKAFPPGPGRFTGTFDFALQPVRAAHDL
jgi:hypothetical protein